jgi:hypothetical protein
LEVKSVLPICTDLLHMQDLRCYDCLSIEWPKPCSPFWLCYWYDDFWIFKTNQRQPEQLLIHLFQKWLVKVNPGIDAKFVPQNFLPPFAKAMSVLHAGQKDNLIYHAARCFGEQRHGNVGRMPLDRMPFIAVKAHLAFF